MSLILIVKYVGLFFLLFLALKAMTKIDQLMGQSFDRKQKLKDFQAILPNLDACWNRYNKLTLFLACASDDAKLQNEIALFLTNCWLEKNNLPLINCNSIEHIFCHPATCPQSCAEDYSRRHVAELGFNAFDVVRTGIKESVCQSTSVMDDERIWNLQIKWEEIMESLSNQVGKRQQNCLTTIKSPSEKIKALKIILRNALYAQK